jgi:hypothetical protein
VGQGWGEQGKAWTIGEEAWDGGGGRWIMLDATCGRDPKLMG